MATAGIQRAIAALGANYEGLSGADLQALTQLAVRTGAIGAGAYNSNRAAQAESVLHSHAERILKQNVDPNDKRQLIVNDDVVATMSLGAAMGWEFQIRGQTLNAQNTWAQFHDTDGNKQSSVTPPGLEGCEA